jgi:hypothetical protein
MPISKKIVWMSAGVIFSTSLSGVSKQDLIHMIDSLDNLA